MNEIAPFNYSDLSATEAAELEAVTARIKARMARTVENIIEIGRDLALAKKRLGHGNFLAWIDAEFGMSDQTARNFMNVARRFSKSKTVLDLPMTQAALYLLAAPSTDDEVVDAALAKAEAGEKVGKPEVEGLKKALTKQKAPSIKKVQETHTKEEAGRKRREEQEHQKQRDLNDARGITKFLRNRLGAEDFNTFRRVIADYGIWRAFLEVTSDRELVPPEGCAMKTIWEDGEAYIAPSAKHPGFFFVAILLNDDAGGADVEGNTRPVRADGVAQYIKNLRSGSVIPDGIEWETIRADPWDYNLYLGPHDPLSSPGTAS